MSSLKSKWLFCEDLTAFEAHREDCLARMNKSGDWTDRSGVTPDEYPCLVWISDRERIFNNKSIQHFEFVYLSDIQDLLDFYKLEIKK